MSAEAAVTSPGHPNASPEAVNGQNDQSTHVDVVGDEEDESDDYGDDQDEEAEFEEDRQIAGDDDDDDEEEDEEEDEDDGEQANGGKDTLTHLLLGNPNAPVEGDEFGDEEEDDEDEDDDEYVYEQGPAPTSAKKRSRDEIADEDDSQGGKKVKA